VPSVWSGSGGLSITHLSGCGCRRHCGDEMLGNPCSSWGRRPRVSVAALPDNLKGGSPRSSACARAELIIRPVARRDAALHPPLSLGRPGGAVVAALQAYDGGNAARSRLVASQPGGAMRRPPWRLRSACHTLRTAHNPADGTAPSVHCSSRVDSYNPLPHGPGDHFHPVVEGVGVTHRRGEYRLQPSS
jgi:hypothetical protein